MGTIHSPDGPLPLATRRLTDAVRALADPEPLWIAGVCRWQAPLYVRLRADLRSKPALRTRGHSSLVPCRVDILALLIEIDASVGSWEPHGKSTVDRLHALAGRSWRPQDCAVLEDYCGHLQRWTLAATEALGPEPKVYLRDACPRCGARFAYHDRAGEPMRTPALRVSESGARCGACRAFWAPERFHWLARLLGCDPIAMA